MLTEDDVHAIRALDVALGQADPNTDEGRARLRELRRYFECWTDWITDRLEPPSPERTEIHRIAPP